MLYKELTHGDQNLIAIMQAVCFGRLENLKIVNGHAEPTSTSRKIVSANFDHDYASHKNTRQDGNFILTEKHTRFFKRIKQVGNGRLHSVQIIKGLPVKAEIEEDFIV